jgi:hypothetical protein
LYINKINKINQINQSNKNKLSNLQQINIIDILNEIINNQDTKKNPFIVFGLKSANMNTSKSESLVENMIQRLDTISY